jgi:O-methyltransferase involved in polyketide biosynthesis
MIKRLLCLIALLMPALVVAGDAPSQYPILDDIAAQIVQKYQQATCEQLWEQKAKPKTAREQEIIQMLRNDPQMRTYFLDKVAGPITNKMFECGMIP